MKKISSVVLVFGLLLSVFAQSVFAEGLKDVNGHKNEDAINYLYGKKIISGYLDSTYKPNNPINRAELLKILVEAKFGTPDSTVYKNCFTDVMEDWYAKYVCYSKNQGWVAGYPDGTFSPGKIVTKAEAIKMLLSSNGIKEDSSIGYEYFSDVNSGDWYYPFVVKAKKMFLLEELSGELRPNEEMTRAKVSEMLYRFMEMGDLELEKGTYSGKEVYTVKNGFITYYFDPTLFPLTEILNMYVRQTVVLQRKSYDYVAKFLGFDPERDIDFAVLSSDGKESSNSADSKKFTAYLKDQIKYENLKNIPFGLTGQLVLIFLAGDSVSASWLAQGLASYVDNKYKYDPIGIGWVYCKDTGWEQAIYNSDTKILSSSGVLVKYSDFSSSPQSGKEPNDPTGVNGFVRSGECFWDHIISKYGVDKFESIIDGWATAQKTPSDKKFLVRDIIGPVIGEDLSQMLKDRYNYVEPVAATVESTDNGTADSQ